MRFARAAPSLSFLWAFCVCAETFDISVKDYRFSPAEVYIKAGDTVQWNNDEKRVSHSVLFTTPGGTESDRIFPGESWRRTFDRSGVHPYVCGPHPEMRGIVIVE